MHCHLLIPGLTPYLPPGIHAPSQALRLPGLETLLTRGEQNSYASGSWIDKLCGEFGLARQYDWPAAALVLLAEGRDPGKDSWLLAAPVHLQLQRDRMMLMNGVKLDITKDEADNLTTTLNRHFASNGLVFSPTRPDRWHIQLSLPTRVENYPLEAVIGKNIQSFLPDGPQGKLWRQVLNEIQMLLHDHPVNVAREQHGKLPINSLWPWGGGVLPDRCLSPYAKIWTENDLAIGLAILSGTPNEKPTKTAAEWLQHAEPGQHLILLDDLHIAALHGDFLHWRNNLQKLDANWFNPLRHALSHGRLTRVSLTIFENSQTRTFSASRIDLWKFWHRRKPFMIFPGASST